MSKLDAAVAAIVKWIGREFPDSGREVAQAWDSDGMTVTEQLEGATQICEVGKIYRLGIGANAWKGRLGTCDYNGAIAALAGAGHAIDIEFEIDRYGRPCNVTARPAGPDGPLGKHA